MANVLRVLVLDDSGQGLAEYGLILGLIAAVCVAAVTTLGINIQAALLDIGGKI
jgi:pilus assembly protein Flp/PilA